MRLAILLLAAIPLCAQFQVSASPESLKASQQIFGKSRGVGRWFVSVCSDYPTKQSIDRVRILQAVPSIPVLPMDETSDQLQRQAAQDSRSIIGNAGDAVMGLTGAGTAIGGFISGSPQAEYIGFGITGVQLLFRLFKGAHPAPNATPYLADELPETETLDAGACDRQRWVLAGVVHGAHAEQATIWLPGTRPTAGAPQKASEAMPSITPKIFTGPVMVPVKPGDPDATTTPSPEMLQPRGPTTRMTCDYDPAAGRVYDCSPQSELISPQAVVAAWAVSPKPPSFEVHVTTPG